MTVIERADCSTVTDVSKEHCFFTSLQLLQFNVYAAEKQYRTSFRPDMFRVPNAKGLEVVLHFLLVKLDPDRSKQDFLGVWPTIDMKRTQSFRKAVFTWLTELNRDHVEGVKIPRINSSTFTKACGGAVVHLLERLASLVLSRSLPVAVLSERGRTGPVFSPDKPHLNTAAVEVLQLELQVLRQELADTAQRGAELRGQWNTQARDISGSIETLSRGRKKLQGRGELLDTRQKDCISAFSSDKRFIKTLSLADVEGLRAQVQGNAGQLKQHLQRFSEYHGKRVQERAVVSSIVSGCCREHMIDHDKIALQVPTLVVGEYRELLGEGRVRNTYTAGDLCLGALTKLSHLALSHLHNVLPNDQGETRVSVLRGRREALTDNLQLLCKVESALEQLDQETRTLRAELWFSQPGLALQSQDVRLQSPLPLFSLTGGRAADYIHVSPVPGPACAPTDNAPGDVTPRARPLRAKSGTRIRDPALTPLSMRKYNKTARQLSGSSLVSPEETDKENVVASHVGSHDLHDLSLLDASVNYSFLN